MRKLIRPWTCTGVFCVSLSCAGCVDGTDSSVDEAMEFGAAEQESGAVIFSRPIRGLSSEELERFEEGGEEFAEQETPEEGLGPIFNENSCGTCHDTAGLGGGGLRVETRFGKTLNGVFDPLESQGGSLRQDQSIGRVSDACPWVQFDAIPPDANTIAQRRTTPLFGLGLVDAVPDATFHALAAEQRRKYPQQAGRVNTVLNVATGELVVGKFGWKAQVPTLFQFSGDAYLNEMGITSPLFPEENCPSGDCSRMDVCNPFPELNDDGSAIDAFTDFMQFLAPPRRAYVGYRERAGQAVFNAIGCATCHVPTLRSGPHPSPALAFKTFHPYSDFLLHDMGTSADGIGGQGDAAPDEMRTAPLWGLRAIRTFLHGGNAVSITEAIERHRGQGEKARFAFNQLDQHSQATLLAFLKSL